MARRKNASADALSIGDAAGIAENLRTAATSTKRAHARLRSSRSPAKTLAEDKKLQSELDKAAASINAVVSALAAGPVATGKRRKRRGKFKLLVVVSVAAVVGNPWLRSKVLDLLFGAEEEFNYSPPEPVAEAEPAAT
jgi:hypothetical protein